MQCRFCPDPAVNACAWPSEQFVEAEVSELRPMDIVRRRGEVQPRTGGVARVSRVVPIVGEAVRVYLTIWYPGGATKPRSFEANTFTRIQVQRIAPCGLAACERHMQERGEGVAYCYGHWDAWAKVA